MSNNSPFVECDSPLVSICIPIYGVEQYIERCARSVFEQTYSNIEYIFVNDCTKDRSVEILSGVMNDYPERLSAIRIISHEMNRGLAAARNTAIENCSGVFVMNVDSDDYLEKNAVELLVNKQKETGADIVSGCAIKETKDGQEVLREPDYKSKEEMIHSCIRPTLDHMWRRIIRLSLYKENHIAAKEGVNVGEDWQVLPQLVYYAKKIAKIDDIVYHYNCMNEVSYMSQKNHSFNRIVADQDIKSLEIVENFFIDKDIQYQRTIMSFKGGFYEHYLVAAYKAKDAHYYNFIANKILAIDKLYLATIGWNKFKIRLINRNYFNRRFFDLFFSLVH